eukprot:EG_transcript_19282
MATQTVISCHVCLDPYSPTGSKQPLSLPCGHTYCAECLGQLQRRQCPHCRTAIRMPISQLPRNMALIDLLGEGTTPSAPAALARPSLTDMHIDELLEFLDSVEREMLTRAKGIEAKHMTPILEMSGQIGLLQERALDLHRDVEQVRGHLWQLRRALGQKVAELRDCNWQRDSLEGRCAVSEHLLRRQLQSLHAPCNALDTLVAQRQERMGCVVCGAVFRSEVKCRRHMQFSPSCRTRGNGGAANDPASWAD